MVKGGGANWGTLVPRFLLGMVFVFHGGQKLFGLFGAPAGMIHDLSKYIEGWGWPMPVPMAYAVGVAEFFGGACVLLGLMTRFAAFSLVATMVVAAWKVHWGHGFGGDGKAAGWEYNFVLGILALSLVVSGGGAFSMDEMFFRGKKKASEPPEKE